jgi:hypothetical protein
MGRRSTLAKRRSISVGSYDHVRFERGGGRFADFCDPTW